MNATAKKPQERIVRAKDFSERLEKACEGNPHCPTEQYRGKQKWLKEQLSSRCNITVSPEAVRKWFAGETKPRPKIVAAIAEVLQVDEAWLSLGTKPDSSPAEKKVRNLLADGAVNLVAGIIEILGGHIAFPEGPDAKTDIFAIINGRQRSYSIKASRKTRSDTFQFTAETQDASNPYNFIGVIAEPGSIDFELIYVPYDLIEKYGTLKGGYYQVNIKKVDGEYRLHGKSVKIIKKLDDMV